VGRALQHSDALVSGSCKLLREVHGCEANWLSAENWRVFESHLRLRNGRKYVTITSAPTNSCVKN
jgi:hypothetical protein